MDHNNLWSFAWVAIIIAFVVVRGIIRTIGRAVKADSAGGMARIDAAAKRILKEQQAQRSSVPITQGIGTAAKGKQRPIRPAATGKQPRTASAALLAKGRVPAVVRTGLLSGGKEPVIQRRR